MKKNNFLLLGYALLTACITLSGHGEMRKGGYATILAERKAKIRKLVNPYADLEHDMIKVQQGNLNKSDALGFDEAKAEIDAFEHVTYSNKYCLIEGTKNEFISKAGIKRELLDPEDVLTSEIMSENPEIRVRFMNHRIGYGLFANEFISKGRRIKRYAGELKCLLDDKREHMLYGICLASVPTAGTSKYSIIVDAQRIGNETRFANHSYDPNAMIRFCTEEDPRFLGPWLIAGRDIQPGEEIVWDYGSEYWRALGQIPVDRSPKVTHVYQNLKKTIYLFNDGDKKLLCCNDDVLLEKEQIELQLAKDNLENVYIFCACKDGATITRFRYDILKSDGCLYQSEIIDIEQTSSATQDIFQGLFLKMR